jgi:phytanoyl-CoA hydroxylase
MDAAAALPVVDAAAEQCISDEAAELFRRNGLLVLRNVLSPAELAALQAETATLVERAAAGTDDPDYRYTTHPETGETIPFRVEYVIDKLAATKALLAHPFLLRTVEKLQGPGFIPTWDSMVFKHGGAGAPIAWHRDGGMYAPALQPVTVGRVFNVDVYLDRADLASCLWGLLGSNTWDAETAASVCAARNDGGVSTDGAVPLTMEPGDVIVHDVLVLHGSEATRGPLRRVVSYEFRPLDVEDEHGPHTAAYIEAKQHVLTAALRARAAAPYASAEEPYVYWPRGTDAREVAAWAADPPTWRYAHEDHWRWTADRQEVEA